MTGTPAHPPRPTTAPPAEPHTAQDYWEDFYRGLDVPADRGSRPNPLLVAGTEGLAPGTALDLGCGLGGDAIWLAGRGWRVTAVDVSATALGRAADLAAAAGVADRITWRAHDLSRTFPEGAHDLVSAQFLHSPVAAATERESILARAAGAVAPGGALLVGSHAGWPSWMAEPPFAYHFATNAEVLDALALDPGAWAVEVDEVRTRESASPDGRPGHREDSLLPGAPTRVRASRGGGGRPRSGQP